MDMRVSFAIVWFSIHETHVESFHLECGSDPISEFADGVPYVVLFGDVEIVESGDMAAGGDYQMAGGQRNRVWHGDHITGKNPRVIGRGDAIWTS
jgi:hypothetical protein